MKAFPRVPLSRAEFFHRLFGIKSLLSWIYLKSLKTRFSWYLYVSHWEVCNYVKLKECLSQEVAHLGFLLQFRFDISRHFNHVNVYFSNSYIVTAIFFKCF